MPDAFQTETLPTRIAALTYDARWRSMRRGKMPSHLKLGGPAPGPPQSSSWRQIAAGMGVVILGVVLALALLEVGARVWRNGSLHMLPPNWIEDADLIYVHNPVDYPDTFVNKAPGPPRPGRVLVACLGGSTTAGFQVPGDRVWPAIAEKVLRDQGIDADVVNAAVAGYGSRQLLVRYRRDVAPLHPDFVVIYEGWNKTGALVDPHEYVPFAIVRPEDGWPRRLLVALGKRFLVVRLPIAALRRVQESLTRGSWVPDQHHDIWVSDMRSLAQEILANGQTPVIVVYPALYHADMTDAERDVYAPVVARWKTYRPEMVWELERKHAALRAMGAELGVPVIEAQSALKQTRGAERLAFFFDEMHMTESGHAWLGRYIGEVLVGLVQSRP